SSCNTKPPTVRISSSAPLASSLHHVYWTSPESLHSDQTMSPATDRQPPETIVRTSESDPWSAPKPGWSLTGKCFKTHSEMSLASDHPSAPFRNVTIFFDGAATPLQRVLQKSRRQRDCNVKCW